MLHLVYPLRTGYSKARVLSGWQNQMYAFFTSTLTQEQNSTSEHENRTCGKERAEKFASGIKPEHYSKQSTGQTFYPISSPRTHVRPVLRIVWSDADALARALVDDKCFSLCRTRKRSVSPYVFHTHASRVFSAISDCLRGAQEANADVIVQLEASEMAKVCAFATHVVAAAAAGVVGAVVVFSVVVLMIKKSVWQFLCVSLRTVPPIDNRNKLSGSS